MPFYRVIVPANRPVYYHFTVEAEDGDTAAEQLVAALRVNRDLPPAFTEYGSPSEDIFDFDGVQVDD